jgi:hypothetical protein
MVKQERKINHGMTNLGTSRSLSELNTTQINNNNNSTDKINNDESNKTKFYRSWTHKLLAPDMYQPPISHANYRYISKTATWNPAPLYERDFSTTFQTSFSDPRDKPPIYEHKELTFEELEQLQALTKKQKESMKVLTDEAKLLYGTTSSMLKSVRRVYVVDDDDYDCDDEDIDDNDDYDCDDEDNDSDYEDGVNDDYDDYDCDDDDDDDHIDSDYEDGDDEY